MTNKTNAVLVDFKRKQDYIFGSNKLKTHIGASVILQKKALNESLLKILKEYDEFIDFDSWKRNPENTVHLNNSVEIGYVGGGNALIFFKEVTSARQFISQYTLLILEEFRGLKCVCTLSENFDLANFPTAMGNLHKQTKENEKYHIGNISFDKWGFEDACSISQGASSIYNHGIKRWISAEVEAKLAASEKASLADYIEADNDFLKTFALSLEIDDLNGSEDKGYIGVIHLDGNGLGLAFRKCKSLAELRNLSSNTNTKLEETLKVLLLEICQDLANNKFEIELIEKNGKKILPFRPIINAGDDITFVCHGMMALYYAKRYIELLASGDMAIHTCAGVLICKKHQPLHKAYQIAEILAGRGKNISRDKENTSWLTYAISPEMISEDILDNYYDEEGKPISAQPYLHISSDGSKSKFEETLEKSQILKRELSKNKIYNTKAGFWDTKLQNKIKGEIINGFKENAISKTDTFFSDYNYDSIELLDFYLPENNEQI